MKKCLKNVLLMFALLTSSVVQALSLGEIHVESALNQPLLARIALNDSAGLGADELLVSLASAEDFRRFAIDRPYFLDSLRFEVDGDVSDGWYVTVSSSEPVREPFLSFVVDLRWAQGRLLTDYTVLLDPPVQAAASSAPTVPVTAATPVSSTSITAAASVETVTVGDNDTLWNIALRVRPDASVSVQQTMLALQRLNPEAFINSNINLVRRGAVLRVPGLAEVATLVAASAREEVARQHALLAQPRADAANAVPETLAPAPAEPEPTAPAVVSGELSVLARSEADGGISDNDPAFATGGVSQLDAVSQRVGRVLDELEQVVRENADLSHRLGMLEQQIAAATEIILLRDDELARLQQQLAQRDAAAQPVGSSQGLLVTLLENTRLLGGLVVALLALVLLVMLLLGRSRAQSMLAGESVLATALRRREGGKGADRAVPVSVPAVISVERPVFSAATAADVAASADHRIDLQWDDEVSAKSQDSLLLDAQALDELCAEVDELLAHGKRAEAEGVLNEALAGDPANVSLQQKLAQIQVPAAGAAHSAPAQRNYLAGADSASQVSPKVSAAGNDDIDIDALVASLAGLESSGSLVDETRETANKSPAPDSASVGANDDDLTAFDIADWDLEPIEPTLSRPELTEGEAARGSEPDAKAESTESDLSAPVDQWNDNVAGDPGEDEDETFSLYLSDSDEAATRLNLARAYIDMGDTDGARGMLKEVMTHGAAAQIEEARKLLDAIG